jgi:imidazolonepropionase-like amidohydrolase
MHRSLTFAIAVALGLTAASATLAQSREIPAPDQDRPVVIHSATVHPVSGPVIESGHVVFDGGVITAVGAGDPPETPGATRMDAGGMHVYPGLIASDTTLGLVETGAVDVTLDHTELGRLTPEVRAAVAINPDTDHIPVARANGILAGMIYPRGGLVAGRCSFVQLDGWTWEDMTIDAEAGLVVNWPRMEPVTSRWRRPTSSAAQQRKEITKNLEEIERFFDDAEAYLAARDHDDRVRTDLRFEAMDSALRGEKPVFVRASTAGQIEAAVAWAVRRGYRIVIVGGTQADRVMPLLLKHDVPVIIGGLHRMPSARHGDYDEPFTLPKRLHEGGVRFAIASGSGSAHERNLNHNAATAAAFGLPRDQALRAVTLSAAEILGVSDRLGALEPGKSATLIVTSGDPLEITTDTLVAFIDGRRIDLGNRQKSLYAKYREKYRQRGLVD